jgi:hypothetical protein
MYVRSSLPEQDKVPDCNAYEALWNRYERAGWSDDPILHIEGISGRKRTYQEFRTRTVLAATALGYPVSDGSLGFRETGEMVAIISHNSLVREGFSALESYLPLLSGLCCTRPFLASSCNAVRLAQSTLDTL